MRSRFGLLQIFLRQRRPPEIVERLWISPNLPTSKIRIPSLFKERLFVCLSRYCEVRYCIVRHCAFLVGHGNSAGDPSAPDQTVEQVIRLLKSPSPWNRDNETVMAALEAGPRNLDWPAVETELEEFLFTAASLVFVEPARSERARRALGHALGGRRFEPCSDC